jgi:hypothetical protein
MLITTKKGTRGKFRMTYNNYWGLPPVNLFDLLNAKEFMKSPTKEEQRGADPNASTKAWIRLAREVLRNRPSSKTTTSPFQGPRKKALTTSHWVIPPRKE